MMTVYCSAVLEVYPPFQHFDDSAGHATFFCTNYVDYNLSDKEVEWLYSNFTLVISTSGCRICGITNYHVNQDTF